MMDCLKTRCTTVFYDYRANLIDYTEFKRRMKVIDDEIKNKQGSLELEATKQEEKTL